MNFVYNILVLQLFFRLYKRIGHSGKIGCLNVECTNEEIS